MKALLAAFALLSFVAASTLPMVASATEPGNGQTETVHHKTHKKTVSHKKTTHHKVTKKKTTHHKRTTKKTTHHKHATTKHHKKTTHHAETHHAG
jgi:Ni/Co efflux regulator RcnB